MPRPWPIAAAGGSSSLKFDPAIDRAARYRDLAEKTEVGPPCRAKASEQA